MDVFQHIATLCGKSVDDFAGDDAPARISYDAKTKTYAVDHWDAAILGREALSVEEIAEIMASPDTVAERSAALSAAVTAWVESVARARGYDSAAACASYAPSTVSAWAADAEAFVKWRDDVWSQVLAVISAMTETDAPTGEVSGALAALPVIAWP